VHINPHLYERCVYKKATIFQKFFENSPNLFACLPKPLRCLGGGHHVPSHSPVGPPAPPQPCPWRSTRRSPRGESRPRSPLNSWCPRPRSGSTCIRTGLSPRLYFIAHQLSARPPGARAQEPAAIASRGAPLPNGGGGDRPLDCFLFACHCVFNSLSQTRGFQQVPRLVPVVSQLLTANSYDNVPDSGGATQITLTSVDQRHLTRRSCERMLSLFSTPLKQVTPP